MKKIVIGGMVASGKSTVAELLAKDLGFTLVPEFNTKNDTENRQFLDLLNAKNQGKPFMTQTFQWYTLTQAANRQMRAFASNKPVIVDRDIQEHLMFAKRSIGNSPEMVGYLTQWHLYDAIIYRADLYVILDINHETMIDRLGLRGRPEEINTGVIKDLTEMHKTYTQDLISMLDAMGVKYMVIDANELSPEELVEEIKSVISEGLVEEINTKIAALGELLKDVL